MKRIIVIALLGVVCLNAHGQHNTGGQNFGDVSVAAGSYRASLSAAYSRMWRLGNKRQRLGIGLGVRGTSYLAKNSYYITAPAELTSGDTGPLVIFKENVEANIDSLLLKTAQVNMVNLMLAVDYRITTKFLVGFSIDLVGASFGGSQRANFMSGNMGQNTMAKPTTFNVLLISDNDRGSLNSDFYVKYLLTPRWSVRAGAQFLFTEYITDTPVQTYPEENDRFRNKALMASIGATYSF